MSECVCCTGMFGIRGGKKSTNQVQVNSLRRDESVGLAATRPKKTDDLDMGKHAKHGSLIGLETGPRLSGRAGTKLQSTVQVRTPSSLQNSRQVNRSISLSPSKRVQRPRTTEYTSDHGRMSPVAVVIQLIPPGATLGLRMCGALSGLSRVSKSGLPRGRVA